MVLSRPFLVAVALCLLSWTAQAQQKFITVASTTSTEQSGLFKHLLPLFEKKSGIQVRVVAQGTGQALDMGKRGDADVVFVHARALEEKFVAEGFGVRRFEVMYNDFVLVGPKSDPAKIGGTKDIVAGLKKIKAAQAAFASRGDRSGTHFAELELWKAAGIDIDPENPDFGVELLTEVAKLRLKNEGNADQLEGVLGGAKRIMGPRVAAKWLRLLEKTTAKRDFAIGSTLKPEDLRAVNAPVYGMYGQNSMTLNSGRALADALPDCRFEALPKAGHFFPASRPRDFAFRSLKFLAAHTGASRRARAGAEAEHRYLN